MFNYLSSKLLFIVFLSVGVLLAGCQGESDSGSDMSELSAAETDTVLSSVMSDTLNAISEPLVDHMYTADPSAHVFDGTLYILSLIHI